jgi:hypothetical protein
MIFQRGWRPEHRQDSVAGELVDRSAITLHHFSRTIDQLGHDLAQPLSPHGRGNIHRMNYIGEQQPIPHTCAEAAAFALAKIGALLIIASSPKRSAPSVVSASCPT